MIFLKPMLLREIAEALQGKTDVKEKNEYLKTLHEVSDELIEDLSDDEKVVVRSLFAIGQADRLLGEEKKVSLPVKKLIQTLLPVEKFYLEIGGLIGYQARLLDLLSIEQPATVADAKYSPVKGIDIQVENEAVRQAVLDGLKTLPQMAEIYPLGGAADRLRLRDENTGLALPAARLPFLGKTLLEGIVADLQAREHLYYKLFGQQIRLPIAMMTSHDKDNHAQIVSICEEADWFGRPKDLFRFFCQPLVPTLNKSGLWCLQGPSDLLLKPGGHGVIWKLAQNEGIFDWLSDMGAKKGIVRQINNPIAGIDYGLLAFTGIGCQGDKTFGFASCPRQMKAAEGINVVVETTDAKGTLYALSCIEYCDFKKYGIIDGPHFSSNTNILFVDLKAAATAARECPFPGILVNLKKTTYQASDGQKRDEEIGRLESTMQNISDIFTSRDQNDLPSYLTYNKRRKTISTAKREFTLGASLLETPEGCFIDLLYNSHELLHECGFETPPVSNPGEFFQRGPSFIFLYHPALGPLYSLIKQKLRRGRLGHESELQLEIADADIENLDIEGSLRITAESVMGHFDISNHLTYSHQCGKCILTNVKIRNCGIDRDMPNVYWRGEIARHESCQIILRGHSEFVAENVTFSGDHFIEVDDGYRVRAVSQNGKVHFIREPLSTSWSWSLSISPDKKIEAVRKELPL